MGGSRVGGRELVKTWQWGCGMSNVLSEHRLLEGMFEVTWGPCAGAEVLEKRRGFSCDKFSGSSQLTLWSFSGLVEVSVLSGSQSILLNKIESRRLGTARKLIVPKARVAQSSPSLVSVSLAHSFQWHLPFLWVSYGFHSRETSFKFHDLYS